MYVNQLPFVITYGRGMGLTTVKWIPNRMGKQLATNLSKVIQLYSRAGFTLQTFLMDMEFEKLKHLLIMANINLSAPNEHVAELEKHIQTVKEWCQGVMATLPFSYFPNQRTINLVQFAILWLNAIICCHKLDVANVEYHLGCTVKYMKNPNLPTLCLHGHGLLLLWDPLETLEVHTIFCLTTSKKNTCQSFIKLAVPDLLTK